MSREKASDKEIFLGHLKNLPIISVAVKRSGVPRSTIYRWKNDDPVFAKQLAKALSKGVDVINDMAESVIISKIREKSLEASKYWLNNHHENYRASLLKLKMIEKSSSDKSLSHIIDDVDTFG